MGQKARRIANAFLLGFLGSAFLLILNSYADITSAVSQGDWTRARTLGVSLVFGAILAGLRALQSYVPQVPSPESDESK